MVIGARKNQPPSGPQGVEPSAEAVRAARDLKHLGHRWGRALLAAHVMSAGGGWCLMNHIQSEPIAGTAPAGSTLMVASDPGHSPAKLARSSTSGRRGSKLSGLYVSDANPVTVGEYARQWAATGPHRPATATRVASLISKNIDGTKIGSMRFAAVRPHKCRPSQRPIPSSLTGHASASSGALAVHLRSDRPRSAPGVQPRHAAQPAALRA